MADIEVSDIIASLEQHMLNTSARPSSQRLITSRLPTYEALIPTVTDSAPPSELQTPEALFTSIVNLRNYFHKTICNEFFVNCVLKKLSDMSSRLARLSHTVQVLRARELIKASRRCKSQREVTALAQSERGFSLLASQRFTERLTSFIPEHLAPLRSRLFIEPALQLAKHASLTKASQRAFLGVLSRRLHQDAVVLEETSKDSTHLATFVSSVAGRSPHISQEGSGCSNPNKMLVTMVVSRLESELTAPPLGHEPDSSVGL